MPKEKSVPPASTRLLLAPYAHEREQLVDVERSLRSQALSLLCPEPIVAIPRRPRPAEVPEGSYVVVGSLVRLGTTPMEVLRWIAAAQERRVTLYTTTGLKLCPGIVAYDLVQRVLQAILAVSREHRSLKTKESLFLARQRGVRVGRVPLPTEVVEQVKATFAEVGSVRGTARKLKERGVECSRSAVQRIVAAQRQKGARE